MRIKSNKGITLVALIITIIVLLILAVVSIGAIKNGGIITHAESASSDSEKAEELERVNLAVFNAQILKDNLTKEGLESALKSEFGEGNYTLSGEEAPFIVIITSETGVEYIIDKDGNVTIKEPIDGVAIPSKFYHVTGSSKEEGIVVADENGNEYVWVPVTKNEDGTPTEPYIETNGKMATTKGEVEIQLGRYTFDNLGNATPSVKYYKEDTVLNHNSKYENAIAKDIEKFKESVSRKGGYFIGRYEAGIEGGTLNSESNTNDEVNWTGWTGGTLVVKSGKQVWNYVTQNKASELCRNIDKNYTGITSDLINSYAWDTAIVFIQVCGINNNYANQQGDSITSLGLSKTGETILKSTNQKDVQCNIYDMAGNCWEWSTETFTSSSTIPCTPRGGNYSTSYGYTTSGRSLSELTKARSGGSFRPILYWQ